MIPLQDRLNSQPALSQVDLLAAPVIAALRALPAELTSKGKALLDRAEAAVRGADEQVLANLTRAQQRQLRRLLDAAAPPGYP